VAADYKHPNWQRKRLEILNRDNFTCVACADRDSTLHVHHIAYGSGDIWDVPDEFLQTLCEQCHGGLGSHPKGGLGWYGDSVGQKYIVVFWCPRCEGKRFRKIGNEHTCHNCGWRTEELNALPEMATTIEIVEDTPKKKTQAYSAGWLKGIVTKARNAGATDQQLFDVVFPESDVSSLFASLQMQVKALRQSLVEGEITEEQETAAILAVVRARRSIVAALRTPHETTP
jgi:hypothetical protein